MFAYIRRLGRDSLFYGALDVANRFVGIFLVPLYTRVLAPADYGTLDLITTLMTVLYALFYLGLDSALIYYYNRTDEVVERRRVATTAIATWTVTVSLGSLVLLLLRQPAARLAMPGIVDADQLIWLAALSLPLQALISVQTLMLRIRFAFKRFAFLSLGGLLTNVALNVYLVLVLRLGVEGILLAQLYSRFLFVVLGFFLTRREFARNLSRRLATDMVRYGAPLVLPNIAYWVVLYFERYALLRLASLDDVGLFGIATRFATFVTLASNAIDIAWMPFALSIQRDRNAPGVYAHVLTYYLLISGLAGTGIALFAREALIVLTQPAYYAAYVLVGPIVASLVLRGAFNILAIGAFVKEQTRLLGSLGVVSAMLDVLLLIALIPLLGALGAALATLFTRLAGMMLFHILTRRIYPVPYEWGRIGRMAMVFAITVVLGALVSRADFWTSLLVKILLLLPLMAISLLISGVVERRELNSLVLKVRQGWMARQEGIVS